MYKLFSNFQGIEKIYLQKITSGPKFCFLGPFRCNHNLTRSSKFLHIHTPAQYISNQTLLKHSSGQLINMDSVSATCKEDLPISGEPSASCESESNDEGLFDSINYEDITGGDEELLKKFKLLLLEVDVLSQDGMKVPKFLSSDQWRELFSLPSRTQRRRFLDFLWTREIRKMADKRRKERAKAVTLEKQIQLIKENENNEHIRYGFQGNTIFIRVYDSTINMFDNNKLIQAMQFGQTMVLDCSYHEVMTNMETALCAKQLTYMFAENRLKKEPFNLHFCNFSRSSTLYKRFHRSIPILEDPAFPVNITEDSYLDFYPKGKLVYLTPHCRTELETFNHDDIYIIGAMVDKQTMEPLSMAKAKRQGLRMAQLPLDRYLAWSLGSKSLTINQVLNILHDVRTTGDWNVAMQNVPKRKLRTPEEVQERSRKLLLRRNNSLHSPISYKT